jgi:hypothetical protein
MAIPWRPRGVDLPVRMECSAPAGERNGRGLAAWITERGRRAADFVAALCYHYGDSMTNPMQSARHWFPDRCWP